MSAPNVGAKRRSSRFLLSDLTCDPDAVKSSVTSAVRNRKLRHLKQTLSSLIITADIATFLNSFFLGKGANGKKSEETVDGHHQVSNQDPSLLSNQDPS